MTLYHDDVDRLLFLELFEHIVEMLHVVCHAYCLMDTHLHLVLTTCDANLSMVMKRLNGSYAQRWNRRHSRVGHVFQGRFHTGIVQDGEYFLKACRYVALNPSRAGLVRSPQDWKWSSYRATAGLCEAPTFLCRDRVWQALGASDGTTGASLYQKYVLQSDDEREEQADSSTVLGDAEFVARLQSWRDAASREVPRRERCCRPPLNEVFAGAVARTERNAQAVRAYSLGYSMSEISRYLGLHYSTISRAIGGAQAARWGQTCKKLECKT